MYITRSREIAQTKMFMMHNILGEDAKIFDPGEEQKPAKLPNLQESLKDLPPCLKVSKKDLFVDYADYQNNDIKTLKETLKKIRD